MAKSRLEEIRELVKKIRRTQTQENLDYRHLTAPCGLPCFACYLGLAGDHPELQALIGPVLGLPPEKVACRGCRREQGQCGHLPMPCRVYPCAAKKGLTFCCDCADFPCDYLHPYFDRAQTWHNTKVFNLGLIKKMGLEAWARQKAGRVLEVYSYGQWTL
jgi:hypothetical protein